MKLWGDMEGHERELAALDLVRGKGLSYSQAARLLVASKGAIAGALSRAEGRETYGKRMKREGRERRRAQSYAPSIWSEQRLTEPWAVWSARKRLERRQGQA